MKDRVPRQDKLRKWSKFLISEWVRQLLWIKSSTVTYVSYHLYPKEALQEFQNKVQSNRDEILEMDRTLLLTVLSSYHDMFRQFLSPKFLDIQRFFLLILLFHTS